MVTIKDMDTDKRYNQFKNTIKSLWDVPDELIKSFYSICRPVHIKNGHQFIKAGEIPKIMGFNLNGLFRLYYIDSDGNDLTKGFCTPGKFIVSYSAMAQERGSYFFIEAIADTDILQFNFDAWMQLVNNDIRWYPFLFKLVEAVYIIKEMREKSFLLDDATTRYLAFLKEYPELENKLKLYHIASFIGITPGALSRIRKNLKN